MGLLEGYKKKYYLYDYEGNKVFGIIPLNKNVNHVGSYCGKYYTDKIAEIMTDSELANFKAKHNFKLEHELGDQLDIYKFLET